MGPYTVRLYVVNDIVNNVVNDNPEGVDVVTETDVEMGQTDCKSSKRIPALSSSHDVKRETDVRVRDC